MTIRAQKASRRWAMPLKAMLPKPTLPAMRPNLLAGLMGSVTVGMASPIMPSLLELVCFATRQSHDHDRQNQRQHQQDDADRRGIAPAVAIKCPVVEVERRHLGPPAGADAAA